MLVTRQDYLDFAGIDLEIELKKSRYDNPSRAVEIFLQRTEDWLFEYMESHYLFYRDMEDYDADVMKRALLYQIEYKLSHGDDDKLSTSALNVLKKAGMAEITYQRQVQGTWR